MQKEDQYIINLFKLFCYNGCRIEYGENYKYLSKFFPNSLVSKCTDSNIFPLSFVVSKIYNTKKDVKILFNKICVKGYDGNFEYRLEHKDKDYSIKLLVISNPFPVNFICYFAYTQLQKLSFELIIPHEDMYEFRQKLKLHMYEDCFGSIVCLYIFLINGICPDLKYSIINLILCVKKWDIFDVDKLLNIYEH